MCVVANSGSNKGLKIFLLVGIVGAALVACIIVGVVVGVLMTASVGLPRTPCDQIALPYSFTNLSQSDCVYGYYRDSMCMYDGYFDAKDNTDKACYGKKFGADHISGGCYYNDESTCHCSMAYRQDENLCYNFAVNISLSQVSCANGLVTDYYCLYEKRKKQNHDGCQNDWDLVSDDYCYMRKKKICDKPGVDGVARKNCLKGASVLRKSVS